MALRVVKRPPAARGLRVFERLLRRYCPIDREVRIEWWHKLSWYADASDAGDFLLIRLSPYLTGSLLRDVMAHEWAHCMAWDRERTLHGPVMFRAYSRAYRVLVDGWRPKGRMRWK